MSVFDAEGNPIRFHYEIVDKHTPESNVHEFAWINYIEVVEFHLNVQREFVGDRRNRALDASLTVKARLEDLAAKRLDIDAHNLLCQRPKCEVCSTPLPLRTIVVSVKDCWKCDHNVSVAIGDKDGQALEQDDFTNEELAFARAHGVTLERRFSGTAEAKYLANCVPVVTRYKEIGFYTRTHSTTGLASPRRRREHTVHRDQCTTRICLTHGEYYDYDGERECPRCVEEAERVMCPHDPERECFYPSKCNEGGCYFMNRARF